MNKWTRKDLLDMQSLAREEIELILKTAESFKEISERPIKKVPTLRGKTVVTMFFEPSTRTRSSFELAAKRLSADLVNLSSSSSSITKGESLTDTVRNIEAFRVDTIITRHSVSGFAHFLSKISEAAIINAGDTLQYITHQFIVYTGL